MGEREKLIDALEQALPPYLLDYSGLTNVADAMISAGCRIIHPDRPDGVVVKGFDISRDGSDETVVVVRRGRDVAIYRGPEAAKVAPEGEAEYVLASEHAAVRADREAAIAALRPFAEAELGMEDHDADDDLAGLTFGDVRRAHKAIARMRAEARD